MPAHPHADPPPRPPTDDDESPRQLLGRFLLFLGPIVTMGGALTVIRLGKVDIRSAFFAAFLPIGLILWLIGWRLHKHR